jgi:hypothetical protein
MMMPTRWIAASQAAMAASTAFSSNSPPGKL